MSNTLRIYALGGLGINIGSQLLKFVGKEHKGYAKLEICFVDTSGSNLIDKDIDDDLVYLLDGVDGSGKKRSQNYAAMVDITNEILHRFKPGDVNIVLHSASGGSGAVLGTIIVSELLKRNQLVIPVMVGSTGSRIEVDNTIKTLKSYEMISKKSDTPVVACYKENSKDTNRTKTDNEIITLIILITILFSGQNRELDKADLNNFINYHNVTDYSPKLTYLDFYSREINIDKGTSLVTVATLCDEENSPELDTQVEYQAVGYVLEDSKDIFNIELPIHAATVLNHFTNKVGNLEIKLASYREAREIVVERSIATKEDSSDATDKGILL